MPLLIFIARTRTGIHMPVIHVFIPNETYEGYLWAWNQIQRCMNELGIDEPSCILHDRSRALTRALEEVFPRLPHLLCMWHLVTAVESNADSKFARSAVVGAPGKILRKTATSKWLDSFY